MPGDVLVGLAQDPPGVADDERPRRDVAADDAARTDDAAVADRRAREDDGPRAEEDAGADDDRRGPWPPLLVEAAQLVGQDGDAQADRRAVADADELGELPVDVGPRLDGHVAPEPQAAPLELDEVGQLPPPRVELAQRRDAAEADLGPH